MSKLVILLSNCPRLQSGVDRIENQSFSLISFSMLFPLFSLSRYTLLMVQVRSRTGYGRFAMTDGISIESSIPFRNWTAVMDCAYTHAMRPYKVPRPNAHPCASSPNSQTFHHQLPTISPAFTIFSVVSARTACPFNHRTDYSPCLVIHLSLIHI